jgi:hypothetical protein
LLTTFDDKYLAKLITCHPTGGSVAPTGESPRAETLVGWLLEHQDLPVPEMSDSDSSSDVDISATEYDDSDSMSDDYEDMEGTGPELVTETQVIYGQIVKKKLKVKIYGPISASPLVHTFICIAFRRPYSNFPESDLSQSSTHNSPGSIQPMLL